MSMEFILGIGLWAIRATGSVPARPRGCCRYWCKNIYAIVEHHPMIALDGVGSGKTAKPGTTYTLDDVCHFIDPFMDWTGMSHASLITGSLGGLLALQIALWFPGKLTVLS